MHKGLSVVKREVKDRDYLEELGIDGRVILKLILRK